MAVASRRLDRKEQIVSAAIERLSLVGFEGFRLGDVASDVSINNATLVHHFPSKAALINAVVEQFTGTFLAVADQTSRDGTPRARLARHMRSSLDLMRTSPGMFRVLNEIMAKAGRDPEIAHLVSAPLTAWRDHIVSLILSSPGHAAADERLRANAVAAVCMTQLLGIGLLARSGDDAPSPFLLTDDRLESQAIAAVIQLVEDL